MKKRLLGVRVHTTGISPLYRKPCLLVMFQYLILISMKSLYSESDPTLNKIIENKDLMNTDVKTDDNTTETTDDEEACNT